MAVAAQADGLLPISQHAVAFHGKVAYHDFEGVALDVDEQKRLVRDLGTCRLMILRNHGLLTAGRSVAEALQTMLMLEKACVAQIAALGGGARLRLIPPPLVAAGNALFEGLNGEFSRDWQAFLRLADRIDPSFRA
jgi:ribulose-5-phosphate 4-epimerase/fuculose-1-phosphate aldolase